jgi:Raf kinase inhibitor-like YbhB/YbcL family protein
MSTYSTGMSLTMTSPDFSAGGEIPRAHTCEGDDLSPALRWTGVPDGTRSLALIVDDPDAPDPAAPRMVYVHWVLYNLPTSMAELPGAAAASGLPAGAHQGVNDWGRAAYGGPCPPIGRHRYFFKLYALDTVLPELQPATKAAVEKAMTGHVLASSELMGTYVKARSR